jgi:LCP family protein required for cell wall assembly
MSKKKILLIAVGVVIAALAVSFLYLYEAGKKSLRGSAEEAENEEYLLIKKDGKKYRYNEDWIHILCLGVDKEVDMSERDEETNSIGQSDAIFLVSINPEENEIQIIAIPRDTMVPLEMYDSEGDYLGEKQGQLCLQYAYADGAQTSCELTEKTVSQLLGNLPIRAYAAINMSAIPIINDAVGGVDVAMDEDYTIFNPEFEKGATVHLEGEEVLDYLHKRDITVDGSAYTRISRQKQYMLAFMEQAKQALKEDPTIIADVYGELDKKMITSMDLDQIVYLVTEGASCSLSEENLHVLEGTITRGEDFEEYYLDEEKVQDLLIELFYE